MSCTLTHVGTATVLIEVEGLRILTDPVFDPAGSLYKVGLAGLVTQASTLEPALTPEEIGPVDLVLLSHDGYRDNLDVRGLGVLREVERVLTTPKGTERLQKQGIRALGLKPWQNLQVLAPSGRTITITAVPARQGPHLAQFLTDEVTGFVLEWTQQIDGALYLSGDTRFYRGIAEIAGQFDVGVAVLHLGGAQFDATGPIRYTMNGAEAVQAMQTLGAHTAIPVHYDGWTHFTEGRADVERAFAEADLEHTLCWLTRGVPTHLYL